MRDTDITWNLTEGTLAGGKVSVNGFSSGLLGTGKLKVKAEDVGLSALIEQVRPIAASQQEPAAKQKNLGRLSGEASVDLYQPAKDQPRRITGEGKVQVRGGELWDLPVLQQLGATIGWGSLGRISDLNADLKFEGNHVVVHNLVTNGTILALSGQGTYAWDKTLAFRIYGQALKATGLVPFLTQPLSWLFEAELTGTLDKYQWKLLGPLRRILPGDGTKKDGE
jgi:hypothetical protein